MRHREVTSIPGFAGEQNQIFKRPGELGARRGMARERMAMGAADSVRMAPGGASQGAKMAPYVRTEQCGEFVNRHRKGSGRSSLDAPGSTRAAERRRQVRSFGRAFCPKDHIKSQPA
jgi:hypothetical protein